MRTPAVTVLSSADAVLRRRGELSGDLAALAESLRADLVAAAPTLGGGWLPKEKAKLTRSAGTPA